MCARSTSTKTGMQPAAIAMYPLIPHPPPFPGGARQNCASRIRAGKSITLSATMSRLGSSRAASNSAYRAFPSSIDQAVSATMDPEKNSVGALPRRVTLGASGTTMSNGDLG